MDILNKIGCRVIQLENDLRERSVKLAKDDIRLNFLEYYCSCVYEYYISSAYFHRVDKFELEKINCNHHIDTLVIFQLDDEKKRGYEFSLNRHIFLSSFTSFEYCIEVVFEYLIQKSKSEDKSDYEIIVKDINKKLLKTIDKIEDKNIYNEIFDIIKSNTFIPLSRKFKYITEYNTQAYNCELKEDKKFIEFISKLRNCISHSNGLYTGNDFSYQFNDTYFTFKKNEELILDRIEPLIIFDITVRMYEIFKKLIRVTEDIEFIKNKNNEEFIED